MRIFIACLATETNTFAPFPTGMSAFQEGNKARGADSPLLAPLTVYRDRAAQDGHEIVESLGMVAMPSGITVRSVYEELRDTILKDLAAISDVDAILLMLHGAMVADGYDDCEGDLLTHVRKLCPAAVIGAVLDPHCHMSATMVEAADLLIPAQEYPHTDFALQGEKLYAHCTAIAKSKIRPIPALLDLRMIGLYPTAQPIMRNLYETMAEIESGPGIVSASLIHGFPWGDVQNMGTRILVYSATTAEQSRDAAVEIAAAFYPSRFALRQSYPSITEALDRAAVTSGPVVMADFADNAHGGAPSDSSFFLEALVQRESGKVAIGAFWDPVLAEICADAGIGAKMNVRLGGKCGPSSGIPIDIDVEIMNIAQNHIQSALGDKQSMGLSVWLRHRDIDIVVCSVRTQVFSPSAFTGLGIDLAVAKLIVVKSMVHFRAAFQENFETIWTVGTPGALQPDLKTMTI
jgi:microcystin degradation protein MlrC